MSWFEQFLSPSLFRAPSYGVAEGTDATIKLDQNEVPFDWPQELKEKILASAQQESWNRYDAHPFGEDVKKLLAEYFAVNPDMIILGPGSNYLITLAISALAKHGIPVIVARPSFQLFELHCRYDDISYEPWELTDDLQYNLNSLPKLQAKQLLVLASPNNPTGNAIRRKNLEYILQKNPDSLVILDCAYEEFTDEPLSDLVHIHKNLLVLRTFSKALASPFVRLGTLVAHPEFIKHLEKLRPPYITNVFSHMCAKMLLSDKETMKIFAKNTEFLKKERVKVFAKLQQNLASIADVIPSQGNFHCVRFHTQENCNEFYQFLKSKKILVRDVSRGSGLNGCLRITLGTEFENTSLLNAAKAFADFFANDHFTKRPISG